MSSSAIATPQFQAKIGSIQNQADSSSVYSNGVWSFKNSTALTSVTITDAGRVGIGTASPSSKLHVIDGNNTFITNDANTYPRITTDNSDVQLGLFRSGANAGGGYIGGSGTAAFLVLSSSFQERMRIDASGNLLVNRTSQAYNSKLAVQGGIETHVASGANQFNIVCGSGSPFELVMRTGSSMNFYVNNSTVQASLSSAGVWTNASDLRYKENVTDISYGLSSVMALKPRSYNLIDQKDKKQIGFIAQEVLDIIPEVIDSSYNSITEEDRYTLSYGQLTAVLVKAIQEQQAQIEALKAEVAALKAP